MNATKGLKAMSELMTKISEAVEAATKAGMSNEQIVAILDMVKETVEGSDE
jgi:DNA-binding transcriptional regulator YhcF (GntR family)